MISFSFSYIKFELYQNNTTVPRSRQLSLFFISLFIMPSFLTSYSIPSIIQIQFNQPYDSYL